MSPFKSIRKAKGTLIQAYANKFKGKSGDVANFNNSTNNVIMAYKTQVHHQNNYMEQKKNS